MRRNPSDCEFVNEEAALVDGRRVGLREFPAPGFSVPFYAGLPPLREKPKLVVGHEQRTLLDIYGFDLRFVSTPARDLLSSIDPEGFEFAECDTVDGNGVPIEPYWMMAVVRVLDRFDEAGSSFVRYADRFPDAEGAADNPLISLLHELRMPDDHPADAHAFFLTRYRTHFIATGTLVDAWKARKLKGCIFTPLQQPTKDEFKDHLSFANYPYWTKKERSP